MGGVRKGNRVQGTVNLVLRKRTEQRSAWLDEIYPLIEDEVKQQLDSMTTLDDESEPNFGDTDYQLAAYAAALRVLTQFADIEGMDIRHELFRERTRNEKSEFEKVIDRAVEIAANHLIPRGFDEFHWKSLGSDERLYLKGLELERHREARAGAYIELAKGFGVREYTNLYERSEANAVRFKTASEFKRQQLEGEGFASSLTRHVLFAIAGLCAKKTPAPGSTISRPMALWITGANARPFWPCWPTSSSSPTSATCHTGPKMPTLPNGWPGRWRTIIDQSTLVS